MNDTQNKVAIEELENLKKMLEGFVHDCKKLYDETGVDWFDGKASAYNNTTGYLQARIDFLDKMA